MVQLEEQSEMLGGNQPNFKDYIKNKIHGVI